VGDIPVRVLTWRLLYLCKEEEKREETANKLTIVGGQPDRKDPPAFSTNIEQVLLKAVEDDEFRDILFKDRKSALEKSGLPITPQDKAILESIPAPTLTVALTNINKRVNQERTSRRGFLKASAAGFGFMVGSFLGIPTMETRRVLECSKHMEEIRTALHLYSSDNNGNYPISLEVLTQISPSSHKPYMGKIPTCPVGNTLYEYEVDNPPVYFHLRCNKMRHHEMMITLEMLSLGPFGGEPFYQLTAGIR
jgi:hypothetical protein